MEVPRLAWFFFARRTEDLVSGLYADIIMFESSVGLESALVESQKLRMSSFLSERVKDA